DGVSVGGALRRDPRGGPRGARRTRRDIALDAPDPRVVAASRPRHPSRDDAPDARPLDRAADWVPRPGRASRRSSRGAGDDRPGAALARLVADAAGGPAGDGPAPRRG